MYSFPRAVTKYHNWDGLKHKKSFSHNPAGWKSRVSITGLKPRSGQDTPPREVLGKNPLLAPSVSGGSRHPSVWGCTSQISPP